LSVCNRNMLATVEILYVSFVVNYVILISFVVQCYNVDQYVLFLHLNCVIYTALIHVHWIRESKLYCKLVELRFV